MPAFAGYSPDSGGNPPPSAAAIAAVITATIDCSESIAPLAQIF